MAGRMISGAAALAELVRAAGENEAPGVHRMLPVVPELSGLLPGRGLRRGSTVAVAAGRAVPGGGSTSLMLALLTEASRAGSWCAVVGLPSLGALAAQESGIVLERLALVPDPGPDWPTVLAALIDGVDVVVTAVAGQVAPAIADRLVARARQRGSVLMPFGQWPGADVTLQVTAARWEGLTAGRGRLRRREVTILARGRGAATRPREVTLWMPGVTIRPPTIPPSSTTGPSPARTDTSQASSVAVGGRESSSVRGEVSRASTAAVADRAPSVVPSASADRPLRAGRHARRLVVVARSAGRPPKRTVLPSPAATATVAATTTTAPTATTTTAPTVRPTVAPTVTAAPRVTAAPTATRVTAAPTVTAAATRATATAMAAATRMTAKTAAAG